MMYLDGDDEDVRYKKASDKRTHKKAKHKHDYEDVLLTYKSSNKWISPNENHYRRVIARRCKICGWLYSGIRYIWRTDEQAYIDSLPQYHTEYDISEIKYI